MKYFKDDKIAFIAKREEIKSELHFDGQFLEEKYYNTFTRFQIRLQYEVDNCKEHLPQEFQTVLIRVLQTMIKEARDEGDWDEFGVLHTMIGHNHLDPNFF